MFYIRVKLIPFYCEEKVRLYHGDCTSLMPFLGQVDLTVTSPPYDDLREYNGYSFDFESAAGHLFDLTKDGGVVIWIVADQTTDGSESGTSFKQALYFKQIGFNLHDTMIWTKNTLPLTHNRYEQAFEYMFVFSKGVPKTFCPLTEKSKYAGVEKSIFSECAASADKNSKLFAKRGKVTKVKQFKRRNNVWYHPVGFVHTTSDKAAFDHPAVLPESLARDHILSWSAPGDVVFDPFAGSGTTLKMARNLGRQAVGVEISADYCRIVKDRLKQQVLSF